MKKIHIIVVLSILFLAACARPKALVYKGVERVGFRQSGLVSTMVMIDLKLYNPNKYELFLKSSKVGVYINDIHIGDARIGDQLTIPKNDTFVLAALLNVDILKVLPNAYQILMTKEVNLKLDGSVLAGAHYGIGCGRIYMNVPVRYEGKQKIDIRL